MFIKYDQAIDTFNELVDNAKKKGHFTCSRSDILAQLAMIKTEDSRIEREHRRVQREL